MTDSPLEQLATHTAAEWVGAIGSAFGAVGTIAAVIFAIYLAGRDGKRLEVERREAAEDRAAFRKREDEEAERRFRDQATKVSLINHGSAFDHSQQALLTKLEIRNDSSQPISWVVLIDRRVSMETVARSATDFDLVRIENWRLIEPGGMRQVTVSSPQATSSRFEVQFNDAARQRWQLFDLGNMFPIEQGHPEFISDMSFRVEGSDD